MSDRPLILVADDDRTVRDALTVRLVRSGYDVTAASDAQNATQLFQQYRPAAAIVDVKMPDGDGMSVCQHIRESGSDIPVFLLTGADEGIIRMHLAKLSAHVGANHFVTKPYDGQILVERLKEALELTGAVRSCFSTHGRPGV